MAITRDVASLYQNVHKMHSLQEKIVECQQTVDDLSRNIVDYLDRQGIAGIIIEDYVLQLLGEKSLTASKLSEDAVQARYQLTEELIAEIDAIRYGNVVPDTYDGVRSSGIPIDWENEEYEVPWRRMPWQDIEWREGSAVPRNAFTPLQKRVLALSRLGVSKSEISRRMEKSPSLVWDMIERAEKWEAMLVREARENAIPTDA